jgi:hypothetical protein
MIRTLAMRALLFALPFLIYGIYLLWLRRAGTTVSRHPWTPLIIVGLLLVALSFVVLGLTEGESTKGVYIPPHVVNGKVVPGHVARKPAG